MTGDKPPAERRAGRFDLSRTPDHTIYALLGAAVLACYVAYRFARRHPAEAIAATVALAALAVAAAYVVARLRDRRAARSDAQGAGVIIGTVKRSGLLARARPFVIPWGSFHQHVLVDGPTGAGKTYTFIEPVLRAFCQTRRPAGIFYLDGKGDRVDRSPGVSFDHVFCPEDPASSAYWNPLAGEDPIGAAAQFAAALFPEAAESGANFYEAKAVFAITKVAPAIAFTGFGAPEPKPASDAREDLSREQLEARLVAVGIDALRAQGHADQHPDIAARQLAWLPYRDEQGAEALDRAIDQDLPAPAGAPRAEPRPTVHQVNPAVLNRVLFGDGGLKGLAEALERRLDALADGDPLAVTLAQLRHDIAAIAGQDPRDRAAVFQNLQNRLGHFLSPPFLELCSRSDFRIAEVTAARKFAFLLPTGSFPAAAKPLGRVALAQFKNAVLASQPGVRKVAVLDEFHNFVSDDGGPFLNQARSRDGAAVMAMQSLADLPPARRHAMLANTRTVIVTPDVSPDDASYWADVFGKERHERLSYSYENRGLLGRRDPGHVRVDEAEDYRWTPSEIKELAPEYALIRVTHKRRVHPVAKVWVERG